MLFLDYRGVMKNSRGILLIDVFPELLCRKIQAKSFLAQKVAIEEKSSSEPQIGYFKSNFWKSHFDQEIYMLETENAILYNIHRASYKFAIFAFTRRIFHRQDGTIFHSIDRYFRKTMRQPSLLTTCLFELFAFFR